MRGHSLTVCLIAIKNPIITDKVFKAVLWAGVEPATHARPADAGQMGIFSSFPDPSGYRTWGC